VHDVPDPPDEDEALLDSLGPLAEDLAGGAVVDWDAADSSELTASHKALLRQLRAIARIAGAHERSAQEADGLLDAVAAMETGPPIGTAAQPELRTWGQLILRSYLGRGSFGDVYRAWDPRLDREVALKLLTPLATGESARSSNVISEGRALARVRHPNVVTVYGADQIGGRIGVWMEFVEGRTLAQRIAADGPLAPAEAAALGADLARALAAVHKAGLLHRDVKAQNVMCEAGGRIVLTDFGTAVPHEEEEPSGNGVAFEGTPAVDTPPSTITPRRATLAGTPLYLAPEILDGAAQTPRSDIYALGVLLFHALTGIFPVTGRTLREVHERHREGQRTSLSDARSDLPPALVFVVDRALAPDPAARPQTADEMAASLDAVAHDARAVPTGARVGRATWGVAAAFAVATLGVAVWLAGVGPFRRTGTVAAGGPDLVLVASIENTSGDARVIQMVERAITEAVTRSRTFAVAAPDRVNKLRGFMRRAPDSPLDATAAREAALRDGGIRAVITGSVGPGGRPAIEVRIVSPLSGATVATIKEASGGSEMARMLDALRTGIAGALDAQREALPAPIAEYEHVTTASFEALRTYTQGRTEFERGRIPGAAELFQRAIKLDPDFALAYTWLGWCHLNTPPYDNTEFARGDQLAQAYSPEERLWARGSHLYGLRDHQAAHAAFWALLQLDPLHFWALSNLDYYLHDDLREYEWVISFWEQQAAARPNHLRTVYRTATALLNFEAHAGRAWPYFDRFLEATKDAPDGGGPETNRAFALLAPAWDAWARGRVREAAERMGPVCDAPAGGPTNVQRLREACIRLSVALGQLHRADSHVPGVWDQFSIALSRGDRETLTRLYESKTVRETALGAWIAPHIGIIDDGGDRAESRLTPRFKLRHFADLVRGPSPETLQWFAGHWRMSPRGSRGWLRLAELYADALVRVGNRIRAIEVLEKATSDRRATITSEAGLNWVSARNAYAELLRRLGRDAEAEPVERDLLSMLSEADADHIIAAKLRARYGGSAPRAMR
jgi:tetratricopeptide (TPR) repeat protein